MTDSPATTKTVCIYFPTREPLEEARRAYMADLDNVATPPDSLARWIDHAIRAWAELDVTHRATLRTALPEEPATGTRTSRPFVITQETLAARDHAISEDRRNGASSTRSNFAIEAIRHAVQIARVRNGGHLPTAPKRLPNKPVTQPKPNGGIQR